MYIDLCITYGILCGREITSTLIYRTSESDPQPEKKEKEIVEIRWMDENGENEVSNFQAGDKLSLWVQTKDYLKGEKITLKVKDDKSKYLQKEIKEIILVGKVQADGMALLKEQIEIGE